MSGNEGVMEVADEFENPDGNSRVELEDDSASLKREGCDDEVY